MTTLLIQTDNTPLSVELPSLSQITEQQFYEFCAANPALRIERTATGEVIVMAPVFSDMGDRNFRLAGQLSVWTDRDGTGLGFDSSAGYTLPNGAMRSASATKVVRPMLLGLFKDWFD